MRIPTTPEQWQVIGWTFLAVFVIAGSVGFYFSLRREAADADELAQLRRIALSFWGLAAGLYVTMRLVRRFLD